MPLKGLSAKAFAGGVKRFQFGKSDAGCAHYVKELLATEDRRYRAKCLTVGLQEMELLRYHGGQVGVLTCLALLRVAARWRALNIAKEVFRFMHTAHIPATPQAYLLLLKSCRSVEAADTLITSLQKDRVCAELFRAPHFYEVKTILAALFVSSGERLDARRLVESIPQRDRTHGALQVLLEAQESFADASLLFEKMAKSSLLQHPLHLGIYNALLLHCAEEGLPGDAENVFRMMESHNVVPWLVAWRRLFLSYLHDPNASPQGRLNSVMRCIERKAEGSCPLRPLDFALLINACEGALYEKTEKGKGRPIDIAEAALLRCEAEAECSEPAVFTALLNFYASCVEVGGDVQEEEDRQTLRAKCEGLIRDIALRRIAWTPPLQDVGVRLQTLFTLQETHFRAIHTNATPVGVFSLPQGDGVVDLV